MLIGTNALRRTWGHRRWTVLVAAAAPVVASLPIARAGGTFDGDVISPTQTRLWDVGGALPGINWDLDTLPAPSVDPIVFDSCGDGTVDLNSVTRSQPSLTFKDWVSYDLISGTFALSAPASTLTVGASVSSTYGSDYFADGSMLTAGLDLGPAPQANTISFIHLDTGTVRLMGPVTGLGSLTLMRVAGASNTRGVYYDSPNGGYSGSVTITTGTAARLLNPGRTGTGPITLQGGSVDILSSVGPQAVGNTISSALGTESADWNYTAVAVPPTFAFPMGAGLVHTLGPVTVDNPTFFGGTSAASITFAANQGFNFTSPMLVLGNAGGFAVPPSRTVSVVNGDLKTGYAGSIRQTGPNRLNEVVVTTNFSGLFDLNPVAPGTGLPLIKSGTGVLSIDGDNQVTSMGAKTVTDGVLRFITPISYGTTTGMVGGPPVAITLIAAPGPAVNSAMGIAYGAGVPGNLATVGAIPGQSGAFDVDMVGNPAAIVLPILNTAAMPTGLRLGSSTTAFVSSVVGPAGSITPYTSPAPVSTYFLGGGGGQLLITSPMIGGPGPDVIEMGTSGTLLPGRVELGAGSVAIPGGTVNIRAGTLTSLPVGNLAGLGITSLGAYSLTLSTGAAYGGAPGGIGGYFDGPGQLILAAGAGYIYGPGGSFGASGLLLEGGAIGWTGAQGIPVLPGVYGATKASTLYTTIAAGGGAIATNILHFGGEYSAGTMTVTMPGITNNGATPVALLKSGIGSILNLTALPAASTYTGGTGIMGGEVLVNGATQMGPASVVIADGGILHVSMPVGPPTVSFAQPLRVANGVGARASQVNVDAGVTATFTSFFEANTAGSILEKTGPGILGLLPGFLYPSGSAGNSWGIKATAGLVEINQLPGILSPANGVAAFDGGGIMLMLPPAALPVATQYSPSYGFGGIETYAGTASGLSIAPGAFFRITGATTSSLMGTLTVAIGAGSVFKVAGSATADDTRGTGSIDFSSGAVQFTPGGGNLLFPHDGGFTLNLDSAVTFSGCPDADITGALYFNPSGSATVTIDGATVSNGPPPIVSASTWTISGTGLTSWNNTIVKGTTFAVPPAAGSFATGTVNINRCMGAPVTLTASATLDIEGGTLNAGGTGDPFTDSSSSAHLPIINNATFNITAGSKHVSSITGVGTTTVAAGAILNVGSSGPVVQSTFTVNGIADVGNVDVTGTTSTGIGAFLNAAHIHGGTLTLGASSLVHIKLSGLSTTSTSILSAAPTIAAGAQFDLEDNAAIVNYPSGDTTHATRDTIRNLLKNGRNGAPGSPGAWNGGGGITSSYANAHGNGFNLAIGYADNEDLAAVRASGSYTTFGGQTVASNTVLVQLTRGADATMDGAVDGQDVAIIGTHFQKPGSGQWCFGDFDYSGTCDGSDVAVLGTTFGKTSPILSPAQMTAEFGNAFTAAFEVGQAASSVPEPSTFAFLAAFLPVFNTLSRRRRRR